MFDWLLLEAHIANGVVRAQSHPHLPLRILNYTERCQYEKLWDDVGLQCRGLVVDGPCIVARPFRKFFNDTEHADGEIPWHLPCEIAEKLDGSLLIYFNYAGHWLTATRGSFTSEQAIIGGDIIRRDHSGVAFNPAVTYLFEVLYPENRIVVDYGQTRAVVLLAMIHTASGAELPLTSAPHGLRMVRRLPPTASARDLRSIITDTEEGFVVRFDNGFRMKVKGARYLELHRVVSGISSRMVWEWLAAGKAFDELLSVVPDEFAAWVVAERASQQSQFDAKSARVDEAVAEVQMMPTRKEQALTIMADFRDVSSAVFLALDGKEYAHAIWKFLYPEYRRPRSIEV